MSETIDTAPVSDRRRFLKTVIQASVSVIAALIAIPGIGFLLSPVFAVGKAKKRKLVFRSPEEAKSTTFVPVRFEKQEETAPGLFFKMEGTKPVVLWARCPHAGCAVEWRPAENQFLCPCHMGKFDANGKNIAGPPPRPLDRLTATVSGTDVVIEEPES